MGGGSSKQATPIQGVTPGNETAGMLPTEEDDFDEDIASQYLPIETKVTGSVVTGEASSSEIAKILQDEQEQLKRKAEEEKKAKSNRRINNVAEKATGRVLSKIKLKQLASAHNCSQSQV